MELKVTKEKVLEAASKCSQAKETLKTLFPEAFKDENAITLIPKRPGTANFDSETVAGSVNGIIAIRTLGPHAYKAFWLDYNFDWQLLEETPGYFTLIPTKKK